MFERAPLLRVEVARNVAKNTSTPNKWLIVFDDFVFPCLPQTVCDMDMTLNIYVYIEYSVTLDGEASLAVFGRVVLPTSSLRPHARM